MDLQSLIVPLISTSPEWKAKIESITGQPVDHVARCINEFLDHMKSGPGIIDEELVKQTKFEHIYQAGLRMGFADWESELAAAGIAGYSPIDIAMSFAKNRSWDVTAEEVENIAKTIAPRFMKKGKEYGLFKDEPVKSSPEIPKVQVKTAGTTPPWRTQNQPAGGNSVSCDTNEQKSHENK